MSAITYTALRKIETTGFSKSGSDISVAASDDSFNAVSTVLSGLLADQWALVSGFTNDANNGWFQIKSDSAAGKILQLTPAVTHLRLPGVSGNYASTPDTAANSVTGDLELIVQVALTDWTPAAISTLLAKWNTTGNQRSYALSVNTDGTLNLSWSNDGTTVLSKNSTVATGVADLATKWVRATLDVNNGAAGNDVKFYLSDDGVSWTQLGTTVTTAATTSVFNSTALLEVGSINSGTSQLTGGRVYYAALVNGLGGTAVAVFDAVRGARGINTVVAATGETWTVSSSGTPPALLQGPALVTEAAGAHVTITGYKRGYGQNYNLETELERGTRSVDEEVSVQKPIGAGTPETVLFREEVFIDVTTHVLEDADLPQWREFLASVQGGELFTFDRYGTISVPVEPATVMKASRGYTEDRKGASNNYRISFKVQVFE